MLYRPFLHYVSKKSSQCKTADKRSYACAAACVSVSRNIIHITSQMKRRGLLVGAYWFTMYTTFFSIVSLVYYVLENPKDAGSQQILDDANAGHDALKSFAQRSQAADRCCGALKVRKSQDLVSAYLTIFTRACLKNYLKGSRMIHQRQLQGRRELRLPLAPRRQ